MTFDKKTKKILITLSTLFIVIVIYNRGSILLNSEIISGQVTSCEVVSFYDDANDRMTSSYAPVVESEYGTIVEGVIPMPNKAACSQQIGQHVSVLFNEQKAEESRIFTFIQFWATPALLLTIPLAILLGIYSITLKNIFMLLYLSCTIFAVYFESGYLEKHFPALMTGKNISQSESALNRCIDTSMRNEYTTKRSEIKKLVCQSEDISDLTVLAGLDSLEALYLQGNSLVSLENMPFLSNLKILSIAGNKKLTSTKGIEKLTALEELQANKAGLINLSGIEQLSNLKVAELMMNKLTSISTFKNLDHLEKVEISYNPVSDISSLTDKPSLIEFSAHGTKINDISALLTNTGLQLVGVSSPNFQCEQLTSLKESLIAKAKVYGPSHCE